MIFVFVFVFFAISANAQQFYRDGQRKSRQLDLELQDITNPSEKSSKKGNQAGLGDLLTTVLYPSVSSSSLLPQINEAQNQQTTKTASALENSLCNPPFDSILCTSKSSLSKSESGVLKPSRDLVPPFNDLEEKQSFEKTFTLTQVNENAKKDSDTYSVFRATSHSNFQATTRKPFTRTTKAQLSQTTLFNKLSAKNEDNYVTAGESTNELRSYLPPQPEYSGAAQTSVQVVQPPEQSHEHHHDHDHHHGHHHRTGDICSDAFHSFLCAPLKARKRITGALPNSLKGQSSFVQYQKVLPNPDKETAPSNTFQNEYLPPRTTSAPVRASPSNIQFTYAPPRTTTKRIITTTPRPQSSPKFIPQPSIENDRFYLPPVTNNKIFVPVQPDSTNQFLEKLQPSSTTQAPSTFTTSPIPYHSKTISGISISTEKPISVFPVSTTIKPIVINNIIPDASFQREYSSFSTENSLLSTFAPLSVSEDKFYLPPKPSPQPAAFLSTEKKFFPTTTFVSQPSSFPTVSTFVPSSSNTVFISPQPKFQPLPIVISTTRKPFSAAPTSSPVIVPNTKSSLPPVPTFIPISSNTVFVSPQPKFQPSPVTVSTTRKPFTAPLVTSSPVPTQKSSLFPVPTYIPQSKFQSASNVISTTVKPYTTTQKPSTIGAGYLPPDPNYQPAAAQIDAAAVAAPRVNNPFHHGRDLCTDPFHSFLCVGPKPRKRITGALPSGFKPESSNVNERVKPAPSFQSENRVKPEKPLQTSPTQSVGYSYPKPINPFPSESNSISSTTAAPTTGYSYPKPEKIFPLPSQQQEVVKITTTKPTTTKKPAPPVLRTSEARIVKGYEYPKPEVSFPLPTVQQNTAVPTTSKPPTMGYSYPKPQKPFPLPTEQKEVRYSTTKAPPSFHKPVFAQPTNEVKGYQYPKPEQSFNLPEKNKGYFYPKPEKRLNLPSESKPKSLLSENNSNLNVFGNLESAEFIPVNKLDKREDSSILAGLKKFGERLRKRERRQ